MMIEQQTLVLPRTSKATDQHKDIKLWILVYFLLLLFEGALRKWVLPALSTPLLIVRDPVALMIIYKAFNKGILPKSPYLTTMIVIGALGCVTAMLMGHHNIFVAFYGARIFFIHFPLIFIIGRVFNQADVIKIGRLTVMLAIPMAVLIALQFYSPQSAWVNRGVGGDEAGAGFTGALGFMRPPGTFSFTNGTTLFFSLAGTFIFYFWLNPQYINKLVLIGATLGLVAAIPLSISRALLFQECVTGLFCVIAIARKPKYMGKMILLAIGGAIALIFLSKYSFFQTATAAFTDRFTGANETEGGLQGVLGDRYIGGMVGGLFKFNRLPAFGYGIGFGTSVGSMLLSGTAGLQLSEDEWGRIIGEMGLVMGLVVIGVRLGVCWKITKAAFKKLRSGDLMSWILLSFCLTTIPQGQWSQPTALGFSVLIGGLCIGALKRTVTVKPVVKPLEMHQ